MAAPRASDAGATAALATAARDAGPRLMQAPAKRAPWAVARGNVDGALPGAARAVLLTMGVRATDLPRLQAGEPVLFTQPSPTGDDTIGTVQVKAGVVHATIISVHDVGGGLKAMLGFREQARDLGRALGCPTLELGGAAVINGKLEEKLQRLGFVPSHAPVPDELGNVDEMVVYTKRFALSDDEGAR